MEEVYIIYTKEESQVWSYTIDGFDLNKVKEEFEEHCIELAEKHDGESWEHHHIDYYIESESRGIIEQGEIDLEEMRPEPECVPTYCKWYGWSY